MPEITPEAKRAAEKINDLVCQWHSNTPESLKEVQQIITAANADKDKVIESLRAEVIDEREALTDYREANIALTQDRNRLQTELGEAINRHNALADSLAEARGEMNRMASQRNVARDALHQAEKARDELVGLVREMAGMNGAWPMREVLIGLMNAVTHLMNVHDCDHHGHENFAQALELTPQYLDRLDTLLARINAAKREGE